jgi:hypothetical protein
MNPRIRNYLILAALALCACGGGSKGSSTAPGSGTPYDFIAPALNSTRSYGESIVDNYSNTIDIGFTEATTAVNADGPYVVQSQVAVESITYGGALPQNGYAVSRTLLLLNTT